MQPFIDDPDFQLYVGDALDVLRELPAESVHCVVTSPPYWGLRDYSAEGQLGLEATPELFVARIVEVFREVRRVLRSDGTCWINLGDSYAQSGDSKGDTSRRATQAQMDQYKLDGRSTGQHGGWESRAARAGDTAVGGLKPKDLCGMPWRCAFALQADGWYLRSAITWCKLNAMPESVTDRPTKATEMIFLLTKNSRYYYDAESIREGSGANARDWWPMSTQAFSESHFATYPTELVRRAIAAGSSERGCCPVCGAPWTRETERGELVGKDRGGNYNGRETTEGVNRFAYPPESGKAFRPGMSYATTTTGWVPSCRCDVYDGWRLNHEVKTVPCTVLDPFMGSGTTALVARKLGRRSIGIELKSEYAALCAQRLHQLSLFA